MRFEKKWFTLIELLISMTIFFIIVVMTYANYAYYQNIARVKMWLKEISQTINEARNLAIAWYQKNWVNQSLWVFFDTTNNNVVKIYSYNYGSWISLDNQYLLKEKKLQQNVGIDDISGKQNIFIYFSSIYAKPEIYYFEWTVKQTYWTGEVDMIISFKHANAFPLKRELKYIKNTNVVDY